MKDRGTLVSEGEDKRNGNLFLSRLFFDGGLVIHLIIFDLFFCCQFTQRKDALVRDSITCEVMNRSRLDKYSRYRND